MTASWRLAAITQRVDIVDKYQERRDALDQAWAHLAHAHGIALMPLPNDVGHAEDLLLRTRPDLLILSGGGGVIPEDGYPVPERNATEARLIDIAATWRLPLFGVCRGMQVLNVHLGGSLREVIGHVANTHNVTLASKRCAFPVNSFHRYGIGQEDLAPSLEPVLFADDGTVEALRHRTLPWGAVMWHPERPGPISPEQQAIIAMALEGRWRLDDARLAT